MDRNTSFSPASLFDLPVALRKESVDRNLIGSVNRAVNIVALRKESVDRNFLAWHCMSEDVSSLSARRAWIEIETPKKQTSRRARRSPQGERG